MTERTIAISPDGSITLLYDDKFLALKKLGKLKCERASDVIFDEEIQEWRIKWADGTLSPMGFRTRAEAIATEIAVLEELLEGK